MPRSALDYKKLLLSLRPKGKLWNTALDSIMGEFFGGVSEELARIDNRMEDLLVERNSLYSNELLGDYELELELPDECSPESSQTIGQRRASVNQKLITTGQQDEGYFEELAAAIGFDITIVYYLPFWSGIGVVGDRCGDQDNLFIWTIQTTSESEQIVFKSGQSEVGDRLLTIDDAADQLFCTMNKYKPGHTRVLLEVTDVGWVGGAFSKAFNLDFDTVGGSFNKGFSPAFNKPGFVT